MIRHISINDTPVGRSVDEVMRLVQAFQFTDENGEVCPSNWKPGKKTMKPKPGDPDLKKYFEEENK
jgi:alkyl hydroperoxide reductase subunit AhpC